MGATLACGSRVGANVGSGAGCTEATGNATGVGVTTSARNAVGRAVTTGNGAGGSVAGVVFG